MGGVNHIGSTQKVKLKIKLDLVVKVLNLSTYLPKLNLWLNNLILT
jgi:hypothetical protein